MLLIYPYTLPPLPYAYGALEPHIDAETMKIHHTKHHQGYVDKTNKALEKYPELQKKPLEELLKDVSRLPEPIRNELRNQGGGHVNHTFFWQSMSPDGGGEPEGALADAIKEKFGSFQEFQKQIDEAAMKRFGSGWAWLVLNGEDELEIVSTANQDSPISQGYTPLLGLDVWEHAYYLKYQNRRVEYVAAWWNVINWSFVEEMYDNAIKT
jgi:Fe-Mn family superoxide dismutase